MNCALIPSNTFYEDLYDTLEEKGLNMHDMQQKDMIQFYIEQLLKSNKYHTLIPVDETRRFESIVELLDCDAEHLEVETILLFSNQHFMYEVIYLKNSQDDPNDLCTITNNNLQPINGVAYITKTAFKSGVYTHEIMSNSDILYIIMASFYHVGLMIEPNGNVTELEFVNSMPFDVIGNTFKLTHKLEPFQLGVALFTEDSNDENPLASKIVENLKGRVFVCLLSPVEHQRYWHMNSETLTKLLAVFNDKVRCSEIEDKILVDNRVTNPLSLL